MVRVLFHSSFERAYRRKVAGGSARHKRFKTKLRVFIKDPFHISLKTHKLTGKLKNYWSFSVEYDLRVIFYLENPETVVFIDVGTHDELYS